MTARSRLGRATRRAALRMVPAARRDWIEAIWAEAPDVPAGWRRLAWRATGVRLMTREALIRARIGTAMLFAIAAAAAAWAAWPGSPGYLAVSAHRALVIAMIVVLAGLPLLARRLFGPAGRSRTARALRVCTYGAVLVLLPAGNIIDGFRVPPRGGLELTVYTVIDHEHRIVRSPLAGGVTYVIIMALCVAAMLWLTSHRSGVTPVTLATGAGAGIVVGVPVYAVAPLGLSRAATNPWLPGSDADPLVLLAWILVLLAPVAAGFAAHRRSRAGGAAPAAGAAARQVLAAGLLTNLAGALIAVALGTGTTALMLKAAWLRDWLYHGQRELFGIAGLRSLLHGDPAAVTYSHQLTASVDSSMFLVMCVAFPLTAFALAGLAALSALGDAGAQQGGNPPGGGGAPPDPRGPARQLAITVAGSAAPGGPGPRTGGAATLP